MNHVGKAVTKLSYGFKAYDSPATVNKHRNW